MVANEDAFSSSSSLTRMDVHGTLPYCEAPTMHSPKLLSRHCVKQIIGPE
jgi:hypothetical protein